MPDKCLRRMTRLSIFIRNKIVVKLKMNLRRLWKRLRRLRRLRLCIINKNRGKIELNLIRLINV